MMRSFMVATLASLASVAHSDEIPNSSFGFGNWSGAAYFADGTNEFSHCVIAGSYYSGYDLRFAINANADVVVGLTGPDWNMEIGEEFPVTLTVDGRRSFSGTATAVMTNMVTFVINDTDGALNAFRRGYNLNISSGDFSQDFALTGTFRALDETINCAIYHFEKSKTQARSQPQQEDSAADKTLLFQIATSMIARSGASDFVYLNDQELEEIGFQDAVVWKSETLGLTSSVFMSSISEDVNLRELSRNVMPTLLDSCDGDAATSTLDASSEGLPAQEIRIVCKESTGGSETFFRQMIIDGILLETLVVFDGADIGDEPKQAREALSQDLALQAASFVSEM